nr:uncharacterized protein LOC113713907 [Coffea arabica]
MEGDLTELMQKFSLAGNELSGATLELEDLHSGVRECEAWGYPRKMTVMELGPNLFQFNIPNPDDKDKIVEGDPWMIDSQMLVLNRWSEGIEENYGAFVTAPLWGQIWNLPVHWLTKEVGRKIGAMFKEAKEVLIPQTGGKEGRHLKILALTDLSKPLLRGIMVKLAGSIKWVAFKYERCPDFCCYSCGIVGHSERSCKDKRVISRSISENQYGP